VTEAAPQAAAAGDIICGSRSLSLPDLARRADCIATGLQALDVGRGDTVALLLRNDLAFFEATAAVALLGAYSVPVNWHLSAEEAAYIMLDCAARVLVVHADLLPQVARIVTERLTLLVVETPAEIATAFAVPPPSCRVPTERLNWAIWQRSFGPLRSPHPTPPGAIIYTSGTTGRPKGVRRLVSHQAQLDALYAPILIALGHRPGMRTIIPAPLYHSAPNTYATLAVRVGAEKIVLMPRFEPEAFLQLIQTHRITHVQMVPTMFVRLLKLPLEIRQQYDVSSLEFVVHAAAPCPADVKTAMIAWWGKVINEYYGATELGSVVFCTSAEWLAHPGSVGRALPGVDVRVLDPHGKDCKVGEAGEVFARIRGASDFVYDGDQAKRQAAERHGLISVGDIGYLDADGFLYLCDRRHDMVISGGVNIYPAEIEAALIMLEGVVDCAVFGIPDPDMGEALCAYVQLARGLIPDESIVRAHLLEKLAKYKVPGRIVFVDSLPREDSGKIFKRKLREPYWAGMQRRI
jgi:long-chain acyl-CoA synthetase